MVLPPLEQMEFAEDFSASKPSDEQPSASSLYRHCVYCGANRAAYPDRKLFSFPKDSAMSDVKEEIMIIRPPMDYLFRIRMLLAQNLMSTCSSANCEPDEDTALIPVELLSSCSEETPFCSSLRINDMSLDEMDNVLLSETNEVDLLKNNSAAYIAGYLARRASKEFPSQCCTTLLSGEKNLTSSTIFLQFKEFGSVSQGLCYPTDNWLNTVSKFGEIFVSTFNSLSQKWDWETLDKRTFSCRSCVVVL